MTCTRAILILAGVGFVISARWPGRVFAQNPAETTPPEHKRTDPQQVNPPQQSPLQQSAPQPKEPTAAELSAKDTPASAMLRTFEFEEYQFRSAAEAMPADKYGYRPAQGDYGGVFPGYGPKELRTLPSK